MVDILCDILSTITIITYQSVKTNLLVVMALPLKVLWNLRVNPRQKFALGVIFSLGFIIIAFALVRVVQTGASAMHVNPIWLAVWSMIEASVGKLIKSE